jgi:hypothetical protein
MNTEIKKVKVKYGTSEKLAKTFRITTRSVGKSGKEHDGEYKKINGEYILKLGSRTLKKSNC